MIVRLYLKPGLGADGCTGCPSPIVQAFLNGHSKQGESVRKVHVMREVFSAALDPCIREELIIRNVARLVELPHGNRDIRPWSADEAMHS